MTRMYNRNVIHKANLSLDVIHRRNQDTIVAQKVRGRPDGTTVTTAIPGKIAHPLQLKPGDSV